MGGPLFYRAPCPAAFGSMRAARQLVRALTDECLRASMTGSAATLAEAPQVSRCCRRCCRCCHCHCRSHCLCSLPSPARCAWFSAHLTVISCFALQLRGAASAVAHLQQRLRSVLAVQEAAAPQPGSSHEQQQTAALAAAAEALRSEARQERDAIVSALAQQAGAPDAAAEAATAVAEQQRRESQQQAPVAAAAQQRDKVERSEGEGKAGAPKRTWRGPHWRQRQPNAAQQERQQQRAEGAGPPRRGPRARGRPRPPREGKWWRHEPLRPQEKPDRLVPILLHHTDTCEEVRLGQRPPEACRASTGVPGAGSRAWRGKVPRRRLPGKGRQAGAGLRPGRRQPALPWPLQQEASSHTASGPHLSPPHPPLTTHTHTLGRRCWSWCGCTRRS